MRRKKTASTAYGSYNSVRYGGLLLMLISIHRVQTRPVHPRGKSFGSRDGNFINTLPTGLLARRATTAGDARPEYSPATNPCRRTQFALHERSSLVQRTSGSDFVCVWLTRKRCYALSPTGGPRFSSSLNLTPTSRSAVLRSTRATSRRRRRWRRDIFMGKHWVIFQQFSLTDAIREIVEYQRHPQARAADARFAETNVGVDGNALEQFVTFHGGSPFELHQGTVTGSGAAGQRQESTYLRRPARGNQDRRIRTSSLRRYHASRQTSARSPHAP